MKTFGINGFGRIGRTSFRTWWLYQKDQLDLKLINTSGSMELENWLHLLKYDTNYGVFTEPIQINKQQSNQDVTDANPVLGTIKIQNREIVVTAQRDPAKIPWGKHNVEVVVEATGVFRTEEAASAHLKAGAKKVMLSAPAKGGTVSTAVMGVNELNNQNPISSNASCTTNCVAPVAQIMVQKFGIKKAIMTTIHAYTDDQNTQDNSHKKDLRRARSAAENIIPTTTGAALATTKIIPELKGLFDGMAVRVPTPVGSLSDMVFVTKKTTTVEEVNEVFEAASKEPRWQGVLAVTHEPIVSSDIVGRSESSIVDLSLTQVIKGDLVKVVSWYDNEWGYCCRLLEQLNKV
ncbi:MAG: type I glyceraldehyde-3-phosphate dehydrogenase [Candidatus Pacebacteria bacterium]|nr:type I glyceraldehyde-3-phosphate dehydrogenase [Candidatus Paceibacterota bacterium]